MSQPTLKRKDLHAPFFPSDVFEDYFNPKRNKKGRDQLTFFLLLNFSLLASKVGPRRVKLNFEELGDEGDEVTNCSCSLYTILKRMLAGKIV